MTPNPVYLNKRLNTLPTQLSHEALLVRNTLIEQWPGNANDQ